MLPFIQAETIHATGSTIHNVNGDQTFNNYAKPPVFNTAPGNGSGIPQDNQETNSAACPSPVYNHHVETGAGETTEYIPAASGPSVRPASMPPDRASELGRQGIANGIRNSVAGENQQVEDVPLSSGHLKPDHNIGRRPAYFKPESSTTPGYGGETTAWSDTSSVYAMPGIMVDLLAINKARERSWDISRTPKASPLYRITHKKTRYDVYNNRPWCVCLFHVSAGGDKKICTAVEIHGTFVNKEVVAIRDILSKKHPTTGQESLLQVGFDKKSRNLAFLGHDEYFLAHDNKIGQTLTAIAGGKEFHVKLGVDKLRKGMSTATSAEFCILVELEDEYASMMLELDSDVTYISDTKLRKEYQKTIPRHDPCIGISRRDQ